MGIKQNSGVTYSIHVGGIYANTFLKNINQATITSSDGSVFDKIVINDEFSYYFGATNTYKFNINPILLYMTKQSGVLGVDALPELMDSDIEDSYYDSTGNLAVTIDVYRGNNHLGQVTKSIPATIYGFVGYSHTQGVINHDVYNMFVSKNSHGGIMSGFNYNDISTFVNYPIPVIDGIFGLFFYKAKENEKLNYEPSDNGSFQIQNDMSYRPYHYTLSAEGSNKEIYSNLGSGSNYTKIASVKPITLCDDVVGIVWLDYWGAFHTWGFKVVDKVIQNNPGVVFQTMPSYIWNDSTQNGIGYSEIGKKHNLIWRLNSGFLSKMDKIYLHSLLMAETVFFINKYGKWTPVQLLTKSFNILDNNLDLSVKMIYIKS